MVGRSIRDYAVRPPVKREKPPELVYSMTIEQACEVRVKMGLVEKSLGWIARNRWVKLEELMNKLEPGTQEFWACCVVYEHFEARVRRSIEKR